MKEFDNKICRLYNLTENVVIVDGQPGCGKTMLSPIISTLDRVEIMTFAFEIEFNCRLFQLGKITKDAASSMVSMFVDHRLYQTMMGREVNFRYSYISSVFNSKKKLEYFKRIFSKGDKRIPEMINFKKPILHLTTHDLLSVSEPLIFSLGRRVTLIELVRHPLYMINQQVVNMKELLDNPRDIQICFEYKDKQLPYFCNGIEEDFIGSNIYEKAVLTIHKLTMSNDLKRLKWKNQLPENYVHIPFEKFVVNPYPFLTKITKALNTVYGKKTVKELNRQKVPRKLFSDGINLKIYKRYGWKNQHLKMK